MSKMAKEPRKTTNKVDDTNRFQRAACWLSLVLSAVIISLSIFGRIIVDTFSPLKSIAPIIGVIVIIGCLSQIIRRPGENFGKWTSTRILGRNSAITLITIALCAYVSELLIVDPIERIHFVKYGLLSILIFAGQKGSNTLAKMIPAIVLSISLGCLDESIQYFVPNRVFDMRDILLNFTGSLYGAVFISLSLLWRQSSSLDK